MTSSVVFGGRRQPIWENLPLHGVLRAVDSTRKSFSDPVIVADYQRCGLMEAASEQLAEVLATAARRHHASSSGSAF